jgi:hypothetical protein
VDLQLIQNNARRASFALLSAVALLLASCGSGSDSAPPPAACTVNSVTVTASPATIAPGATATLTSTVNASASCATAVTWSATPAGTLTPSGMTATFTATNAAVYSIRATSTADTTRSGTTAVTVTAPVPLACGQANGVVINHSADVSSSETWAGDGTTHLVPSTGLSVRNGATLTVAPCAVVALAAGASITVRDTSRLVAAGTSETRFVTFRRADAAQAWGQLRGFSETSLIDLAFTRLEGGGAIGGVNTVNAVIRVFGPGFSVLPAPVLRVNNVTIQGSVDTGVYLENQAAFTPDSQALTITGATGRPINVNMMALGSLPGGTYTGNGTDEVLVLNLPNANVVADLTVEDRGVPIRIPVVGMNIAPVPPQTAAVTLTLKPGVVLRFPKAASGPGARVIFGTNGNAPNNLVGVLNAVGTAARPIIFTSGEANPAPGDWIGLWLNTANGSRLDYVTIEYAGAPSGIISGNCRPVGTNDNAALLVGSFSTQYVPPANLITNSRITNSAGFGINAMWQATTVADPNLTAGNNFQNNALCRQSYNALTVGVCPPNGGCTAN